MTSVRVAAPIVAAALILALAQHAAASSGPRWTEQQLTALSAAVVSGHVTAIATAADASGGIYTYVSIAVSEVLKGSVPDGRVVLKQAGGVVGDIGLDVSGQASFAVGEEVLVFAEVRPRDATLCTTALWQGKWTIEIDAASGNRVAVQRDDSIRSGSTEMARVELASLLDAVRSHARPGSVETFNAVPDDVPLSGESSFTLFSSPAKWRTLPARVDVQAGGQPGLAGGGLNELANATGQWNAPSNFKWQAGSLAGTLRCGNTQPTSTATNHLMIEFNDPCAEISDAGGTLAVAFTWFTNAIEETFNGVGFRRVIQVTIVTNNSGTAQQFVTNSNCFNQVLLHEVGHALGLGHSGDSTAVMAATVAFSQCAAAPRPLQPDDIAGVQFIYGGAAGGAPGQPTVTSATAAGGVLTVQWTSGSGGAPTGHRLDFSSGGVPQASVTVNSPSTTFAAPLPAGIQGTFDVTVTAGNGAGMSPPSAPFSFTIGGGAPGQPTVTSAAAAGGVLTVNWTSGAGAAPTAHRLDFFQGGSLLTSVPTGAATSVGLPLPAGVQGSFGVQVIALNGAIASPPSALFDFTIGPSCTPPTAPVVTGSVVNGTASVGWPAVPGATNYILSAGTTQGGTQVLGPTNLGTTTGASASGLPPGFQAWVRVIAVNACGQQSAPTDLLLQ
ncbi:MAG: matrixin family metalloprotease [Vicinamibacterales bacterium]